MTDPLPRHFFFYGTLMTGVTAEWTGRLATLLQPVGNAMAAGRLFARCTPLGFYPVFHQGPGGRVTGGLYRATPAFGWRDLAALDAYEGMDPANPGAGEYIRATVSCRRTEDGTRIAATAYVARSPRPEPSLTVIPGGDFRAWLAETGRRAFSGGEGDRPT